MRRDTAASHPDGIWDHRLEDHKIDETLLVAMMFLIAICVVHSVK